MALKKPETQPLCIDASKENRIQFNVFGGDQYTGFYFRVYSKTNQTQVVYWEKIYTISNYYTIPYDALNNGNSYYYTIQTFRPDPMNSQSEELSVMSDMLVTLDCYSEPTCSITGLTYSDELMSEVINSQNYSFDGVYSQGESIKIEKHQWFVYDANKNLLMTYPMVYSDSPRFSQMVEGFGAKEKYTIKLVCYDTFGRQCSSEHTFIADYIKPRVQQELVLENDGQSAAVKASISLIQIIFKSQNKEVVYQNDAMVDLTNNKIWVDEQIDLEQNYTIKLYAKNIPRVNKASSDYFFTITSRDGRVTIGMKEYDDRIHVYKLVKYNGSDTLISHYASEVMSGYKSNSSYVVIQINHVYGRIDVNAIVSGVIA